MNVESNSELSFSRKLDAGWTKEKLMEWYCLKEKEYEKVIQSLKNIREKQGIP